MLSAAAPLSAAAAGELIQLQTIKQKKQQSLQRMCSKSNCCYLHRDKVKQHLHLPAGKKWKVNCCLKKGNLHNCTQPHVDWIGCDALHIFWWMNGNSISIYLCEVPAASNERLHKFFTCNSSRRGHFFPNVCASELRSPNFELNWMQKRSSKKKLKRACALKIIVVAHFHVNCGQLVAKKKEAKIKKCVSEIDAELRKHFICSLKSKNWNREQFIFLVFNEHLGK